jgi:hypothetical protein
VRRHLLGRGVAAERLASASTTSVAAVQLRIGQALP